MHGRDRHFVSSLLRKRFMPAVVTARNTPGTHNQQCVRSVRQGCTATGKENGGHTRYLGSGACSLVIGAKDHRMDFCLVHNIAK